MGFEAYTEDDHGVEAVPQEPADWQDWVAASNTYNWCKHQPLLDWLDRYGEEKGFVRDPKPDVRLDFQEFVFRQGHAFEAAVVAHLGSKAEVRSLGGGERYWSRSLDGCHETFQAMLDGVPVIHQAVLRNPETRTYGAADLLVRSDVLFMLFPGALTEDEASVPAPGIGAAAYHYRVIDIKFTTLHLDKKGHASNDHLAYMAQLGVYNAGLGRIQGFIAPTSYLLGRGWEKGKNDAGSSICTDRLASIDNDHAIRGEPLPVIIGAAVDWVRRLRREGHDWDPRVQPSRPELRPNPGSGANQPWHSAVAQLAANLEDVTLAWQVGLPGRKKALEQGIERWTDPRFTAEAAGRTGVFGATLNTMLDLNRSPDGPGSTLVLPERVATARADWGESKGVEFFVDFETVGNLNDDFKRVPEQNGQPLIFMIGCGHIENGDWRFTCFIAQDLTPDSEANIIDDWLGHMEAVRQRLAPAVARPLIFHWSPAETSTFAGLKSARVRSPERAKAWAGDHEPRWFDFLNLIMKKEPVIVRGPMGFGLKTVARSLKAHGLIATSWPDGVADGLGAMVAAWWCADEARKLGCPLADIDLMDDVVAYNEVDCRVMMEAISYLRAHH